MYAYINNRTTLHFKLLLSALITWLPLHQIFMRKKNEEKLKGEREKC